MPRLIHLNLLDGAQDDPARRAAVGAWLAGQGADLVTLNELNGWQAPGAFAAQVARWGWSHGAIGAVAHSAYPVGVLSRTPIEVLGTEGAPFHHSLLRLRTAGLQVWVTHLTPVDAARRAVEAAWIARAAAGVAEPLLLAGDLNTLSPADAPAHRRDGLRERLAATPALRRKFLDAAGEIDLRPMQALLDAGFVDLCTGADAAPTVPTPLNADPAHAAPMRLDHLLGNAACARLGARARVLTGEDTARLSDHRPVQLDWGDAGPVLACGSGTPHR